MEIRLGLSVRFRAILVEFTGGSARVPGGPGAMRRKIGGRIWKLLANGGMLVRNVRTRLRSLARLLAVFLVVAAQLPAAAWESVCSVADTADLCEMPCCGTREGREMCHSGAETVADSARKGGCGCEIKAPTRPLVEIAPVGEQIPPHFEMILAPLVAFAAPMVPNAPGEARIVRNHGPPGGVSRSPDSGRAPPAR